MTNHIQKIANFTPIKNLKVKELKPFYSLLTEIKSLFFTYNPTVLQHEFSTELRLVKQLVQEHHLNLYMDWYQTLHLPDNLETFVNWVEHLLSVQQYAQEGASKPSGGTQAFTPRRFGKTTLKVVKDEDFKDGNEEVGSEEKTNLVPVAANSSSKQSKEEWTWKKIDDPTSNPSEMDTPQSRFDCMKPNQPSTCQLKNLCEVITSGEECAQNCQEDKWHTEENSGIEVGVKDAMSWPGEDEEAASEFLTGNKVNKSSTNQLVHTITPQELCGSQVLSNGDTLFKPDNPQSLARKIQADLVQFVSRLVQIFVFFCCFFDCGQKMGGGKCVPLSSTGVTLLNFVYKSCCNLAFLQFFFKPRFREKETTWISKSGIPKESICNFKWIANNSFPELGRPLQLFLGYLQKQAERNPLQLFLGYLQKQVERIWKGLELTGSKLTLMRFCPMETNTTNCLYTLYRPQKSHTKVCKAFHNLCDWCGFHGLDDALQNHYHRSLQHTFLEWALFGLYTCLVYVNPSYISHWMFFLNDTFQMGVMELGIKKSQKRVRGNLVKDKLLKIHKDAIVAGEKQWIWRMSHLLRHRFSHWFCHPFRYWSNQPFHHRFRQTSCHNVLSQCLVKCLVTTSCQTSC